MTDFKTGLKIVLNVYLSRYLTKTKGDAPAMQMIQYYFYTALNDGILDGCCFFLELNGLPVHTCSYQCASAGCTGRGKGGACFIIMVFRSPHSLGFAVGIGVDCLACCLNYWHCFVYHVFTACF